MGGLTQRQRVDLELERQKQKEERLHQQEVLGGEWREQLAHAGIPHHRGPVDRAFTFAMSFIVGLFALGMLLGGAGFITGGVLFGSDYAAMIGAAVGGVVGLILALVAASRTASE